MMNRNNIVQGLLSCRNIIKEIICDLYKNIFISKGTTDIRRWRRWNFNTNFEVSSLRLLNETLDFTIFSPDSI